MSTISRWKLDQVRSKKNNAQSHIEFSRQTAYFIRRHTLTTRSSSLPDAWGEDVAPDKGLTVYEFLLPDPAAEFWGK